ncbi:hypothetical protein [Streptomyces avermitilis]|uniref:hypothetical protein n=1 Tax=Streptomyces avermitilis TaxID=33903 RepID=UPI0033BE09B2
MNPNSWRWLQRQAQYQIQRIAYLGAGLAGLAGLGLFGAGSLAASVFDKAAWLRLAFLVLSLGSAASLGMAWEPCIRTVSEVERDHGLHLDDTRTRELPCAATGWFKTAFLLLLSAAGVLVGAAAWTAAR